MATLGARTHEREALTTDLELLPVAEAVPAVVRLAPPTRRALFVVHGMGQQLRFETLDAIANGLHRQDVGLYGSRGAAPARAAHVQLGSERLERVEMRLRKSPTEYQDVDLYEAYWAPLTEGAVSLRDVIRFLFTAGLNGIKNAQGVFRHQMFGTLHTRIIPVRSLLFLLIALWVVVSLVVINAAIVAIPAARSPFHTPPRWLSDILFRDLTDLFNATVLAVEAFALSIVVSLLVSHPRRLFRRVVGPRRAVAISLAWLSLALFVLATFAILATGVAVPLLFALHAYGTTSNATPAALLPASIARIGTHTPMITFVLGAFAVLLGAVLLGGSIVIGYLRQAWRARGKGIVFSTVALALFAALVYGVVHLGVALLSATPSDGTTTQEIWRNVVRAGPVWAVLVLLSIVVRRFLVEYAGDVAVYVQSHKVDRFNELRTRIKETVRKTAEAVYAQRSDAQHFDYDEIVLVGHSLGSVIAYDTLNRLLLDDGASTAAGRPYDVAHRTRLLLTFGSPLDKTAFVFTTQSKKTSMTHLREALAAVVQPLIDSPVIRQDIQWVNIYSPWDIISGRLDFYDDPRHMVPPVGNERDPEAVTLLGAHTEYWRNWLVFERLHTALTA